MSTGHALRTCTLARYSWFANRRQLSRDGLAWRFVKEDAVFNETFYGYSLSGDPDAGLLVRYLALVLGSKLAVWLALVTSGKFGFERDVVEKATLDSISCSRLR